MNRERRAVLRGVAALTGATVGGGTFVGASAASADEDENRRNEEDDDRRNEGSENRRDEEGEEDDNRRDGNAESQQIDTSLPPGVTLFDLDGDGAFTATVERASAEMQDDAHPGPIHVTSQGRETGDFAASVVEPGGEVTLGDVDRLTYDYYVGPDDAGGQAGAAAPGQTFVVVENDDGRHGAYLTYDPANRPREEWLTEDVFARLRGDTAGTSGWFEYTEIEPDYDGETFDDFVGRFGTDARLSRVGVGLGSATNPSTLDVYYDNLAVGDTTRRFPAEVANRVSNENPL